MNKFNKYAAGLVLGFSLVPILSMNTATAAGCQVLSKSTLESKADRFGKTIRSAAHKYGVHEDLVKAVITVESCFRTRARGTSGEKGLMQLMPATARRFDVKSGYNPWQNVHGGTRYLGYLLKRYDGDTRRAVAAYNAGEGNVRPGGRIRNGEYVSKVMRAYGKFSGGVHQKSALSAKQESSSSVTRKSKRVQQVQKNKDVKKAVVATRATTRASSGRAAATRVTAARSHQGLREFKVKQGYTVYEVMRQSGVPVKQIIKLNGLKAPYHLQSGQVLKLR